MKQEFDHARRQMVDNQLLTYGVISHELLDSMGHIPRERFVPEGQKQIAYADMDQKLSEKGHFLMAPASFGRLVQLAEISSSDVVLVVGCGSGYSVAVLSSLPSAFLGVEQNKTLVDEASAVLADLDIGNGVILEGSLEKGIPSEAPYDVIIIEGAVDEVPPALLNQLRDGGRLIAVINGGVTGIASVFVKSGNNISSRQEFNAKLPVLASLSKKPEFAL